MGKRIGLPTIITYKVVQDTVLAVKMLFWTRVRKVTQKGGKGMSWKGQAAITTNPVVSATGFPENRRTAGYFQGGTPLREFTSKEWPAHSPRSLPFRYVCGLATVWGLETAASKGLRIIKLATQACVEEIKPLNWFHQDICHFCFPWGCNPG